MLNRARLVGAEKGMTSSEARIVAKLIVVW
jgi:hypothetical protein